MTLTGLFIMSSSLQDTVSKEFYKTVLQCLCNAVRRHRPEKWHSCNWILHHDNAPARRAVTTNEFLAKHNIPSLPQPPYSPDLAPCFFFLFPQLKKTMKGRRFGYVEDIQANATRQLVYSFTHKKISPGINPLLSLTLQSAQNLNVACWPKRSKVLLLSSS